jgi:mannose-6-phosphate isomerase-like protein (cupin superfamily)
VDAAPKSADLRPLHTGQKNPLAATVSIRATGLLKQVGGSYPVKPSGHPMSNVNKIDIHTKSDAVQSGYFNETVTVVNDHVIRVSVMTTSYPWHRHPNSDETFLVMEGILILETQDQVLHLEPGQMATVPANTIHRTQPASARSVNLTVEHKNTETLSV